MTMHTRAAQLAADDSNGEKAANVASSLAQVSDLIRDALAEMRALVFELRPGALADEGLVEALRHQAAVLSSRAGIAVNVEGPDPRIVLDDEVEQQLYRSAVEALHNIVKHAQATSVLVRLVPDVGGIWLTIVDDGRSFDTEMSRPGHLGLSTMADRARTIGAELSVSSALGAGTTVTALSPTYLGRPLLPG